MSEEILDIFDEEMNCIGKAPRSEAHSKGLWHQTFQCWFFTEVNGENYMMFQKRQKDKDTFPGFYDITAAGHLMSGESPEDGVRELEEELGVKVSYDSLKPVGILRQVLTGKNFIDREFCSVFTYRYNSSIDALMPQLEEVAGLFLVKVVDFMELMRGEKAKIALEGFELDHCGGKVYITTEANFYNFVPHGLDYYQRIML